MANGLTDQLTNPLFWTALVGGGVGYVTRKQLNDYTNRYEGLWTFITGLVAVCLYKCAMGKRSGPGVKVEV
mgnify:FL=1